MTNGHHHHHHHHHGSRDLKGKNLLISIVLNVVITLSQIIGGLISGSLALLSDALHNLSDVISLLISYIANVLSRKEASAGKTFGYKRAEIIAAFVNSASLIIVAVFLIKEAIEQGNGMENLNTILLAMKETGALTYTQKIAEQEARKLGRFHAQPCRDRSARANGHPALPVRSDSSFRRRQRKNRPDPEYPVSC